MSESSIERVDEIPIIFHKLKEMGIQERIDRFGSRMATGKD